MRRSTTREQGQQQQYDMHRVPGLLGHGVPSNSRGLAAMPMMIAHDCGGGAQSSSRMQSAGPLIADHLQLQELDLELALLKRKREMIEQQQHLLAGERYDRAVRSQYTYEQPRQSYHHHHHHQRHDAGLPQPLLSTPSRNFARYYSDTPGVHLSSNPGQSVNRQAVKRPANDNSQARTAGVKKRPGQEVRPTAAGLVTIPSRSAHNNSPRSPNVHRIQPFVASVSHTLNPLIHTVWPRPNSSHRVSGGFNPTKVVKPRSTSNPQRLYSEPVQQPNRLNSYPVATRKNLVAQSAGLVKAKSDRDLILHADRTPTPQMTGRLELALGGVLKDVKELHGDKAPHTIPGLRRIKQAIRERVRSAMIGKVVGPTADIIKHYRDMYPKETDKEILALAMEPEPNKPVRKLAMKLVETEEPEAYIRSNFTKLLTRRLNEMFLNIYNLRKTDPDGVKTVPQIMEEMLAEEGISLDAEIEAEAKNQSAIEPIQPKSENDVIVIDDTEIDKKSDVANDGAEAGTSKDETGDESVDKSQAVDAENDNSLVIEEDELTTDGKDDSQTSETINDEAEIPVGEDSCEISMIDNYKWDTGMGKADKIDNFKTRYYTKLVDILIKRRLPQVLPRYKDLILNKIMYSDETFKNTVAYISIAAKKRADMPLPGEACVEGQDPEPVGQSAEEPVPSPVAAQNASLHLPYYVKVMGIPTLPKRKLMQAFLNQFHPWTIKRHRIVHNLLFLGLAEQIDFDNIMAANQTVIGNSLIDIRVCAKAKNTDVQIATPPVAENTLVLEDKDDCPLNIDAEPVCDDRIDSELDEQITELLSSIRKEDENTGLNIIEEEEEPDTTGIDTVMDDDFGTDGDISKEAKAKGEPVKIDQELVVKEETVNENEGPSNVNEGAAIENGEPSNENEGAAKENGDPSNENEGATVENGEPSGNEETQKGTKSQVREAVKNDAKATGRATPTRASARVANSTPGAIRTRRASRLANN